MSYISAGFYVPFVLDVFNQFKGYAESGNGLLPKGGSSATMMSVSIFAWIK